jgi:exonuclease III
VGLLIKRSLALTVVSKQEDRIGNILMLKLSGAGTNDGFLNLFSVYGPNNNDGEFYADLTNFLTNCGSDNIICGGDFNCTWDSSPAELNIDVLNMRNVPSNYRTTKINSIAERFNLIDPFRAMFPNRKEYTYIPNAVANINRSRIDFFLINNKLLPNVTEADVPVGKLS